MEQRLKSILIGAAVLGVMFSLLMVDADARLLDCSGLGAALLEGGPFRLRYGQILATETKRLRELTARTAAGGAGRVFWPIRAS